MKIPREATKRELETMLTQIQDGDSIAIFNARKALYLYIDSEELEKIIIEWIDYKLEKLDDRDSD